VMWPELFGQFWEQVALPVMVSVLAYVVLILFKHRAEEIEQGPRPERPWRPLLTANLGLCISHAGIRYLRHLGALSTPHSATQGPRYYGVKELQLCECRELITPNPRAVVRDRGVN
jgi:hypothetical protein